MKRARGAIAALTAVAAVSAGGGTNAGDAATAQPAAPPARVGSVPPDSLRARVARLVPAVEELRGRTFRRRVPVAIEGDSAAAVHFSASFDRFVPPARRRAWESAHAAFGLFPRDVDVHTLLLDVLAEQAGGYYDPEREAFVLLDDMPEAALTVLAVHEMTHALDDQYYGIDSLLAATADDDDRGAALAAVIEGSGVEVMTAWMLAALASGELDIASLSALAEDEAGRAERLREAPDVVVRSLLAPYVAGHAFLRAAGTAEVTTAIDRAFAALPLSSEQILHPAKYWQADSLDVPSPIPPLDFVAALGGGFERLGNGVFGELELAALTGPAFDFEVGGIPDGATFTNSGASGWDGDQWAAYARGDSTVVAFASRWDSARDAAEFVSAARWPADVHVERRADAVVAIHGLAATAAKQVAAAWLRAIAATPAR